MRTRVLVTSLLVVLSCVASAGGCQVIAGLTVLEITGGTGSSSGQGGGSCAPCANGESCLDSSECQSTYCAMTAGEGTPGICKATKKLGLDCSLDEECGSGYCTDGVCCNVADCGDECLSCAASTGACKAKVGTTCGKACGDGAVMSGLCDVAGKCAGVTTTACQSGAGCNPVILVCTTSCSSSAECASNGFCPMGTGKCAPCGVAPPDMTKCMPGQNGCDSCDASSNNTCVKTCAVAGDCEGASKTITLKPTAGPARLECKGQCNGLKVLCQGPFPCEVVCDDGSCDGLILMCGPDGGCNLTCTGTGCTSGMGPTMNCGDNSCKATCADGSAKVKQSCGGSCDCAKGSCQ